MKYELKAPPIPTMQITMTLDHEESLAILRLIGKSSNPIRLNLGLSEKDSNICVRVFGGIDVREKQAIGYYIAD